MVRRNQLFSIQHFRNSLQVVVNREIVNQGHQFSRNFTTFLSGKNELKFHLQISNTKEIRIFQTKYWHSRLYIYGPLCVCYFDE